MILCLKNEQYHKANFKQETNPLANTQTEYNGPLSWRSSDSDQATGTDFQNSFHEY